MLNVCKCKIEKLQILIDCMSVSIRECVCVCEQVNDSK